MKYTLIILFSFFAIWGFAQDNNASDDPFARTKAIMAEYDKIMTPNGIQENFEVDLGGVNQSVYVRGNDRDNPVILLVHGGPASPLSPLMWAFQRPFEEYFTVVNYDQRASGKTYASNDTTGLGKTLTIDRYVKDAIALAEHIRKKYNRKKVILIGHSWGTVVSMHAALQRPDLFHAYIGMGQVINTRENERLSFEYAYDRAKALKNAEAIAEMESIAPYPGDEPITRERIIIARKWPQYYGGLFAYRNEFAYYFRMQSLSPEYTPEDITAIHKGSLFTLGRLLPEYLDVDFTRVREFPIPVFMFMGRHDYTTPSNLTAQWIAQVKAPQKKGIWFENSSHMIPLEEPGKMLVSLLEHIRPLAREEGN